jgi:predicted nucleic acid-binding protein
MSWVIDASVALRWFLAEEAESSADAVLRAVIHWPEAFAVPELFAFEVLAVLCRTHPRGPDVFRDGMMPLLAAGVLRQPMTEGLAGRAEPFVKLGLTAYDACYAALARELGGLWLTYDQKAHRRIHRQGVSHLMTEGLPPDWPEAAPR